ncbi:hypothetical protein ACQ4PT_063613 [Festuca glaucescens]
MASAGGGIDGAAAGTAKKKKRISDCLVDSDGGEDAPAVDVTPPSPPSPGTPRLRIPMFTCARLRFGRKGGRRRKEVVAEKSEAVSTDSSGWKQGSNGGSGAEATVGMGLSLLFLLAKTCVELNKMAEVRARMEALLEEMRGLKLARTAKMGADNVHADSPAVSIHDLPPSTTAASLCRCRASARARTDGLDGTASSPSPELSLPPRRFHERTDDSFYALTGNPLFDLDRAAASTSGMETASGESGTSSEMEDSMSMDVAGAQFQLNGYNTWQEIPESSSSDGDSFIELEGGFGAGAGVGSSARRRLDSEDEERGSDGGVSALELERRLQELLHRMSRERIEELEASLRRAERKLMEKVMEARLWKDTAKLALQPPSQQQREDAHGAVTSLQ